MEEKTTNQALPEQQTEPKMEIVGIDDEDLDASANRVAYRLMNALDELVDNISSLEVKTYTNDAKKTTQPKLRARTKIRLDGDVEVVIPERQVTGTNEMEIDEAVWKIHREMVDMAQDKRMAFIQTMADLAERLSTLR